MEDFSEVETLAPSGEGVAGFGIMQYGSGLAPYGGRKAVGRGLYLFGEGRHKHFSRFSPMAVKMGRHTHFSRGAGITPYGGLSLKGFTKDLKKAVAPIAKEAVKQFKQSDTGKEILRSQQGRQAVDIGKAVMESRPLRGKTKGIRSILGGNYSADGNNVYELNKGQIDYLNKLKKERPMDSPPAMDRHQVSLLNNIIQGKQILSSSTAKGADARPKGAGMRYMRK